MIRPESERHGFNDVEQSSSERRRYGDGSHNRELRRDGPRDVDRSHRHNDYQRRRSRSPDHRGNTLGASDENNQHERYRSRDVVNSSKHVTRDRHHHHHHHRHRDRHGSSKQASPRQISVELPYSARPLSKSELGIFRPLLARYLDVQKNKAMADMDEREIMGRWKSFVSKWNEGVLAASWYDPELFQETRHDSRWLDDRKRREEIDKTQGFPLRHEEVRTRVDDNDDDDDDDDDTRKDLDRNQESDEGDGYGPVLPGSSHLGARQGPGIPSLQDLEVRREMNEEDHYDRIAQLRQERKADRKEQKAKLEELVPRAEAGTRERQLEKKKEINEKMKGFRERSPGAAEVNDTELMGGGDSLDEYKRMKASAERKKTEKEIRREEILRAKEEERQERLREYREKEDKAMVVLKELARQRFG